MKLTDESLKKAWEEFWEKVPELVSARPMCDAINARLDRFPDGCAPAQAADLSKIDGERFNAQWDNNVCLIWITQLDDERWEWFFRDRTAKTYAGPPDDTYIDSVEEMMQVLEPYFDKVK